MKQIKFLAMFLMALTMSLSFVACGGDDDEPQSPIIDNDTSSNDEEDDSTEALQIVGTWETSYQFVGYSEAMNCVMEIRENGSVSFKEFNDSEDDTGSIYGTGTWTYQGNNIWYIGATYSIITGEYNLFKDQLIHTVEFLGGTIATLVWERQGNGSGSGSSSSYETAITGGWSCDETAEMISFHNGTVKATGGTSNTYNATGTYTVSGKVITATYTTVNVYTSLGMTDYTTTYLGFKTGVTTTMEYTIVSVDDDNLEFKVTSPSRTIKFYRTSK